MDGQNEFSDYQHYEQHCQLSLTCSVSNPEYFFNMHTILKDEGVNVHR